MRRKFEYQIDWTPFKPLTADEPLSPATLQCLLNNNFDSLILRLRMKPEYAEKLTAEVNAYRKSTGQVWKVG